MIIDKITNISLLQKEEMEKSRSLLKNFIKNFSFVIYNLIKY